MFETKINGSLSFTQKHGWVESFPTSINTIKKNYTENFVKALNISSTIVSTN